MGLKSMFLSLHCLTLCDELSWLSRAKADVVMFDVAVFDDAIFDVVMCDLVFCLMNVHFRLFSIWTYLISHLTP